MLLYADFRTLIPPFIYRLERCSQIDVDVLKPALRWWYYPSTSQDVAYASQLLYNLLEFSEMWETSQISKAAMVKRFTDTFYSDGQEYLHTERYCAFSKENSPTCNTYGFSNYDAHGIIYERDQYWNKSATIPSQASVLLLSGKMDAQTPAKYAEALLGSLVGDKKELITFEHATHGIISSTPMKDDTDKTCGMELLVSYTSTGGDLARLDKSCVDDMPELNMTVPEYTMYQVFNTPDVYDGGNLAISNSSSS